MSNITIHTKHTMGFTIIPNYFLDNCMPQANGEFVKVYLYLMRATRFSSFSLSSIADSMNCTENDVLRALKYWSKEGLLELTFDENKKLKSISFLEPSMGTNIPSATSDTPFSESDTGAEITSVSLTAAAAPANTAPAPAAPAPKNTLNPNAVKQLKENEDIAQLLFIAEQYLGKMLTPTETSKILYFYEGLDFSTDLIEYLIEYCVGNNHRSMNYIEKVALNWKDQGISTVEEAKKTAYGYQKEYYTIFKALGIRNRSPIEREISTMKVWLNDFSMELIVEACTRTILTTKQPDLNYVNGILESWKAAGARTLQDVQKLDTAHEQARTEKKKRRNPQPAATRFSNFDQRAYDFDSLESQLLNQ